MGLSVKDRGSAVATFRYIHVKLMEILAQWTPTSPEMEVKLLFGEHIWEVAQHADALGKRTQELRLPLHTSIAPVESYLRLLEDVENETDTARRLSGLYEGLLPGLAARYQAYLERTDALLDAPTVRIIEQMRDSQSRMIRQSREMRAAIPELDSVDREWLAGLVTRDLQIPVLVA